MINQPPFFGFEALEAEINEFLRTKISHPERTFDDFASQSLNLGPRYRKRVAQAIDRCNKYLNRLRPFRGQVRNYSELMKILLERRNSLMREFQRFAVTSLNPAERIFFEVEGIDFQPRLGRNYEPPKRSPGKLPEHLRER